MRARIARARGSLAVSACLAALASFARATPQDREGWGAAADLLGELASGKLTTPAERTRATDAVSAWSRAHPESFESRLAAIHLARLAGRSDAVLEPEGVPSEMNALDAWLTALVLPSGAARAHAFALAIAGASPAELGERLARAFPAFLEEAEALRLAAAEELARAMYTAQPAPWSATTLGVLWTRMGKYPAAEQVITDEITRLDEQICAADSRASGASDENARSSALADAASARIERRSMIEHRAVSLRGAGEEQRGLDDLGRALAEGGRDAAQMLGQAALARGDRAAARALFRTLLEPRAGETLESLLETAPWAPRGWGLAQLPAVRTPKATTEGSRSSGARNP
jgi:hypothetical protein